MSNYYINSKYANSARSLGTDPTNSKDDNTLYEGGYITREMGYKISKTPSIDLSILTKEMKKTPNKPIWTARQTYSK